MKSKIQDKPYLLLWLIPIPFWILAVVQGHGSIDIVIHDTYFVVSWMTIAIFLSTSTMVFVWFYSRLREKLWSKSMTWAQVIFTIYSFYLYLIVLTNWGSAGPPRRYYSYMVPDYEWPLSFIPEYYFWTFGDYLRSLVYWLAVLAFFVFIMNLALGLVLGKKH